MEKKMVLHIVKQLAQREAKMCTILAKIQLGRSKNETMKMEEEKTCFWTKSCCWG